MSDNTLIPWADATWNPIVGCTHAGTPGCDRCYARALHDKRHAAKLRGARLPEQYLRPFGELQWFPERLAQPLGWRKPRRVFVGSGTDLFHPDVPDEWLARVFMMMASRGAEHHTFMILTKRPERMRFIVESMRGHYRTINTTFDGALRNVWLGVTVENQAAAEARVHTLLATPAAKRFVSCEPLLGPVRLDRIGGDAFGWGSIDALAGCRNIRANAMEYGSEWETEDLGARLDWVIAGGETGTGARPMHPDWARSLRDQCVAAGTPFFFKQWGEWDELHPSNPWGRTKNYWLAPDGRDVGDMPIDQQPTGTAWMSRVGKARAGHLLDGREWRQFPEVPR